MPRRSTNRPKDETEATGNGGFLGQIGLFETANGMPHGPLEIILAIVAAIIVYPMTWLARRITRR